MEPKVRKGISGSTLKLMACIIMLIDHIGAVIVWRMVLQRAEAQGLVGMIVGDELYSFYRILRDVGRLAFPIYCFLLVEGFQRSSNKVKYGLRLGLFALLSEIPFDLAFSNRFFDWENQNVFFTLSIGLVAMIVAEKWNGMLWKTSPVIVGGVVELVIFGVGAALAEGMGTDYGAKGILSIALLYMFRRNRLSQTIAGAVSFLWETTAPLAFIPILFYDGRRGIKLKYVFYLFYPLHLLLLYLICVGLDLTRYVL